MNLIFQGVLKSCKMTLLRSEERVQNGDAAFPSTTVTIDFLDKGDSTEVVVTHKDLPSEEAANNHNFGWTSSLEESLKVYLGQK
jgi:Activator of Hsp90 ATPase homolog 1-like protein